MMRTGHLALLPTHERDPTPALYRAPDGGAGHSALTMDQQIPRRQQGRDAVVVFLKGGVIRQSPEGGAVSDIRRNVGDVLFVPAGTDLASEEATQGPPRAVFIELK